MLILENKRWYSIIIAIIIVWFLFAITWAVFKTVLVELNDNRWMYNYLKAFYGVEWAEELALLDIKENWYGYYRKIDMDKKDLISNILNSWTWNINPLIAYDIWSKVSFYSWDLLPLSYDVIPLFYKDEDGKYNTLHLENTVFNWDSGYLSWNIISSSWWLSSFWIFNDSTIWIYKTLDASNNFVVEDKTIWDFLQENKDNYNYLVIFNSSDSDTLDYTLSSKDWFFTKPRTDIIVSSKMWDYKQNISINYDNTDYLGIFKYSIYND